MSRLDGVHAKLRRADEQLEAFYRDRARWIAEIPQFYSYELDAKTGWFTAYFAIAKNPPIEWSVIAGEIVHDLRSALEHLVWQLVEASGGKPSTSNQWPVAATEQQFVRQTERPRGMLDGLSREAFARVRSVQPFQRGDRAKADLLYILHWLWNTDKHRIVYASYGVLLHADAPMTLHANEDAGDLLEAHTLVAEGRIEHGAEILRARYSVPGPDPKVSVDAHLAAYLAFGDGDRTIQSDTLGAIAAYVRDVIAQFDDLLAEP